MAACSLTASYILHGVTSAGQTATIAVMQFAKSDGTRFNPLRMKPQKIQVTANVGNGFDVKTLRFP